MIRFFEGKRPAFVIDTDNTTYAFSIAPSGHPEHLYYGEKISLDSAEQCEILPDRREFVSGNCISYSPEHPATELEDMLLEFSSSGHGDVREPFIEIIHSDGSRSSDFLYSDYRIDNAPSGLLSLPSSYSAEDRNEHLCVTFVDGELVLELHYRVYPECDAITRSARLINKGSDTITLERLLSLQLDIPASGLCITSFHGAWVREMQKDTLLLNSGKYVVESRTGSSSNRANPFFMVHSPDAGERSGIVYGFNLIYSGNHYSASEVNAFGKTRIVSGIQPEGFRFVLGSGESFEAPEVVMTYSGNGFTGQSINMHRFVREHIVRGTWKKKQRPVLLNSWEACYFNVNESTMISLAKAGKKLGAELFVMDDGWFGERKNDTCSLGDWEPDAACFAPGRVNLIGEHTDYNGGHVFPCAIHLGIRCAAAKRSDRIVRLFSENFPERGILVYDLDDLAAQNCWADYPVSVIRALGSYGYTVGSGADIWFSGDLPDGAGLSSSAAIETAAGVILRELFSLPLTQQEIALIGQFAENRFIGVNCGIMDQFASAMGKRGHAVLLDANTLSYKYAPLGSASLVIVNSGVRHSLAASAYNDRRRECEAARKALDIPVLCSLSPDEFERRCGVITDELCRRRARHAVYENRRTLDAAMALQHGDLEEFGRLMNASHSSLRDDFEVSCEELDFLAEFAQNISGVYGARMTGGGFGGCTINLMEQSTVQPFCDTVQKAYQERFGTLPEIYPVIAADGAGLIDPA